MSGSGHYDYSGSVRWKTRVSASPVHWRLRLDLQGVSRNTEADRFAAAWNRQEILHHRIPGIQKVVAGVVDVQVLRPSRWRAAFHHEFLSLYCLEGRS